MNDIAGRRALWFFWLLTVLYVAALLWVDHGKGLLSGWQRLSAALPLLLLFSLAPYLLRYARWNWLLRRAGVPIPAARGLLAYLAGFAFTATPGKLGELLQIRYFHAHGASSELVIAAFFFERSLDLVVVLALAGIAATSLDLFVHALVFVVIVLIFVCALARWPGLGALAGGYFRRRKMPRFARLPGAHAAGPNAGSYAVAFAMMAAPSCRGAGVNRANSGRRVRYVESVLAVSVAIRVAGMCGQERVFVRAGGAKRAAPIRGPLPPTGPRPVFTFAQRR